LQNKVAIVFGAGSIGPGRDNGKASAALFAADGANVICLDINRTAAVSNLVASLVASVVREHGRSDMLHNNVGYATMGGPIELDEAASQRTFDLNVKSCFITGKQVLEQKLSATVNVSSRLAL
jgi:NAD(P)-dependent dehydrogenase (short-subunit alcohol dehydrogenase family)